MAYLGLSRRALLDIEEIERLSVQQRGHRVADEYLDSIEDALARLREKPDLLRTKPEISRHFSVYRVRQHFLVGVLIGQNVYVLAVRHGMMDLPNRLAELEPQLLAEAELLHRTFLAKSSRK